MDQSFYDDMVQIFGKENVFLVESPTDLESINIFLEKSEFNEQVKWLLAHDFLFDHDSPCDWNSDTGVTVTLKQDGTHIVGENQSYDRHYGCTVQQLEVNVIQADSNGYWEDKDGNSYQGHDVFKVGDAIAFKPGSRQNPFEPALPAMGGMVTNVSKVMGTKHMSVNFGTGILEVLVYDCTKA